MYLLGLRGVGEVERLPFCGHPSVDVESPMVCCELYCVFFAFFITLIVCSSPQRNTDEKSYFCYKASLFAGYTSRGRIFQPLK